jgi:hypothetical protein
MVLYEVTRNVWLASDATANAEPTDAWPFSSRVCTKNIEGAICLVSVARVSPSARNFFNGSSSLSISALALSWALVIWLSASVYFPLKLLMKVETLASVLLSRYS